MNKLKLIALLALAFIMFGCSRVEPGNVGVKVYLLGGNKGVDQETLRPGRYWIGINEQLYIFPTFQQNYVWTKDAREGSKDDESITFQTNDGLSINTDVGIAYHIQDTCVSEVFQKYRKGVDEITGIVLRNKVRDAFVNLGSNYTAEEAYSTHKRDLLDSVNSLVGSDARNSCITIDKISYIGSFRLPASVENAINNKINAKQEAQKLENEVKGAQAMADKKAAYAKGLADSIMTVAKAQAEANKILSSSITTTLVKYREIEKWNGVKPQVMGGTVITDLK